MIVLVPLELPEISVMFRLKSTPETVVLSCSTRDLWSLAYLMPLLATDFLGLFGLILVVLRGTPTLTPSLHLYCRR